MNKKQEVVTLSGALFSVLLLVIGSVLANRLITNRDARHQASKVLGTSISVASEQISLNKLQSTEIPDKAIKHISIEVTVKNTALDTIQVSPGLDMLLIDNQGTSYQVTATYIAAGTTIGGSVEMGAAKTFTVDFEIPADRSPITLVYHSELQNKQTEIKL